jgi:hypothetical protein
MLVSSGYVCRYLGVKLTLLNELISQGVLPKKRYVVGRRKVVFDLCEIEQARRTAIKVPLLSELELVVFIGNAAGALAAALCPTTAQKSQSSEEEAPPDPKPNLSNGWKKRGMIHRIR